MMMKQITLIMSKTLTMRLLLLLLIVMITAKPLLSFLQKRAGMSTIWGCPGAQRWSSRPCLSRAPVHTGAGGGALPCTPEEEEEETPLPLRALPLR